VSSISRSSSNPSGESGQDDTGVEAAIPEGPRRAARHSSRSGLVSHRQQDPEQEYDVGDKAGEGTQGIVFRATRKKTGVMRAIKKVPKKKVNLSAFEQEIDIMRRLDHPNIVRLYETFSDRLNTYLVMELCSGGELFDKIVGEGHLNEPSAAIVLQQILRAVHYMHEQTIAHRDLKPENFVFCSKGPINMDNPLKLIDFGLACECAPGTMLREMVGTPYYVAPQVIAKRYDKMCDLWSCGVIMFALLSGNVPFNGPSDHVVLCKVRAGVVRYNAPEWSRVSQRGKELVRSLLTRNPKERITAGAALEDEWIKHLAPGVTAADVEEGIVERLGAFRRKNSLKQAALTIVASELNEAQIRKLRDTFTALDMNMDGLLTYNEVRIGVEKAGFQVSEEVMGRFEGHMDSVIDYTEFVAATLDKKRHLSDAAIRVAFAMFDVDGSGKLTTRDIARVFGDPHRQSRSKPEDVVRRYAKAGEDAMDFEDFRRMMRHDVSPAERSPPGPELPNRPQEDRFDPPPRTGLARRDDARGVRIVTAPAAVPVGGAA